MLSIVLYMKCPLAYKCNVNWPGKTKLNILKVKECKVINKDIYWGISDVICNAKSTLLLLLDTAPSTANRLRCQVCKVMEVKLYHRKTKNLCFIQTASFHTQLVLWNWELSLADSSSPFKKGEEEQVFRKT